ncbi:MAG: DUF1569 domain-containing protein [Luteitalea sp.]|nr:DUF1569 domain-containing protein [Luteitalea sp.]
MKTLARNRDRTEIRQRLKDVRPESVGRWGRMSAHQMVCHLSDSFRMQTGRKPVRHAPSLVERTIVKWLSLYLPLPWPAGIPTRPEIDQEREGTKPVDFAADLAELEALLDLAARPGAFHPQAHPTFGRMSEAAWLRWGYLHVDHHLRQFGA